MLVRCLYASRSVGPMAPVLLDEILAQSRKNNPLRGITGLLCSTGHIFVQVIEGGRDEVCELYNALVVDKRHRDVRMLVYEEIPERFFANWTMGQVHIESVNRAMLLKYFAKAELNPFESSGKATMALLLELIATGAIASRSG